ncbi:Uncharacterised protein [Vibrio cholerae]|nr:Uncharacterised protein [Vibrio cholerae]
MGKAKLGCSPVKVCKKATILPFSSSVNLRPSCKRPMISTASLSVAASPSWK